jgi:hypothetical protein
MVSQQVSPMRLVDEWTCETTNGTRVTYSIIASVIPGFVYSAVWAGRKILVFVSMPQSESIGAIVGQKQSRNSTPGFPSTIFKSIAFVLLRHCYSKPFFFHSVAATVGPSTALQLLACV